MHSGTEFVQRYVNCPLHMPGCVFLTAPNVQDNGIRVLDILSGQSGFRTNPYG